MTPIARWFRNQVERFLGVFYEGPEPPRRLAELAVYFAQTNPHATRGDWMGFAIDSINEAYKLGYIRGVEYVERDPEMFRREPTPEQFADALDPDWREREPLILNRQEEVPERPFEPTEEDLARLFGKEPKRGRL